MWLNAITMNRVRTIFIFLSFFLSATAFSQKPSKTDKAVIANLKAHIYYLADDKLEGRRAGTQGEKLASEYIITQFRNIGIVPKGTDGYLQAFEINDGKQIGESSYFSVNGKNLEVGKEFFPLPFSARKTLEAAPAIAIQEPDMPWFIDLKEILTDNSGNPHFDIYEYLKNNTKKAFDKGASAIILYNTSTADDNVVFNAKDKTETSPIPVIYVTKDAAKKYFSDVTATMNLKLKIDIIEKKRTGHNVVGYIDNGAPTTVVLGAHFDHLGYGEDGNSMLRTGEKLIHNGADDNASGTSALIELSRILKKSKARNHNYLFLAFSGEELGLFGSKYFVDNPTIDLSTVSYMINMDMVGRLNDSTKALAVGGYGTSPAWASVINAADKKLPFVIKIDSSGSGPSDHTSFYRKDIPVLFFFTGQHKDYHRPSDDADKINYEGELNVIRYIDKIINDLNNDTHKLAFLKTRESQQSVSSFKVTMGIMPDYTYSGVGIRADGVSEGRPAAKAGLKSGDVIIQLGDNNINNMDSYMQALNKFNKGDRTKVKFKRGNEVVEADVQF